MQESALQLPPAIIQALPEQIRISASISTTITKYSPIPDILVKYFTFTHFEELIRIEDPVKRAFYEIEGIKGNWSVCQLTTIPTLSPAAIDPLLDYDWPGNVRELQNVVERALILNPNRPISFEHLNIVHSQKTSQVLVQLPIESDNLDQVSSNHIRQVLAKTKGKIHRSGGVADLLGINPSTLRNRMNKLGIEYVKSRRHVV